MQPTETLHAVISQAESGVWIGRCPGIGMDDIQGESLSEVQASLEDALRAWLEEQALSIIHFSKRIEQVPVHFTPGVDGFVVVTSPEYPSCIAQGATRIEAVEKLDLLIQSVQSEQAPSAIEEELTEERGYMVSLPVVATV